jgi:hypothetical protein
LSKNKPKTKKGKQMKINRGTQMFLFVIVLAALSIGINMVMRSQLAKPEQASEMSVGPAPVITTAMVASQEVSNVDSNELTFQIRGLTLSGQRSIPGSMQQHPKIQAQQ